MTHSFKALKITNRDAYRAQVVAVGNPNLLLLDMAEEPIVDVSLRMPLSDARRLGFLLYEWVELSASQATLEDPGADLE